MQSIKARLSHKRVIAAALASGGRQRLSVWWLILLFFAANALAIWQGYLAAFYLVQYLAFDYMYRFGATVQIFLPAVLATLLCFIALAFFEAEARRRYLRSMTDVGVPPEREVTYEIRTDGLMLTSDKIDIFPKWSAIDTVEKLGKDWVLQAEQLTFLIPHDSFASADEEHEFMDALRSHLPQAALDRSPDLRKLVQQASNRAVF